MSRKQGLSEAMEEFVQYATGHSSCELSQLNPDEEIELAERLNGSRPVFSHERMGSFIGRGSILVSNRQLITLDSVDQFADDLAVNGARRF